MGGVCVFSVDRMSVTITMTNKTEVLTVYDCLFGFRMVYVKCESITITDTTFANYLEKTFKASNHSS